MVIDVKVGRVTDGLKTKIQDTAGTVCQVYYKG